METLHIDAVGTTGCAEHFLASVHAERERVRKFLAAYQTRLEKAEALIESHLLRLEEQIGKGESGEPAVAAPVSEYQRRYELVLNDLQVMKAKNAELQRQLGLQPAAPTTHSGLDWEAEKRRVLAALEAGCDPNNLEQKAERLRIEDVLRTTEHALAVKDAEIEELKHRLQEATNGQVACHSEQNREDLLNGDSVVREERQRLADLQNEWREKLRQAEVDFSIERAKLARQRVELEEQMRSGNHDANDLRNDASQERTNNASRQTTRGRWLARLGITDTDQK